MGHRALGVIVRSAHDNANKVKIDHQGDKVNESIVNQGEMLPRLT